MNLLAAGRTLQARYAAHGRIVLVFALFGVAGIAPFSPRPSHALPSYSLRYEVPCSTCHTVSPRLNSVGRAFQANYFNWAVDSQLVRSNKLIALPVAAIATASSQRDQTGKTTNTDFRALELYPSDGFTLSPQRRGGYFADVFAVTKGHETRVGALEDAYVAVPVAGNRGQWAIVAGQATPLLYQYDPVVSLTDSLPSAFSNSDRIGGALSLTQAIPMLRVDYFDHRGLGTEDGNYVSLGLPFSGQLALNHDARVGGTHGVIGQIFRRQAGSSVGLAGYVNGSDGLLSLLGTHAALNERLYLIAAASEGHNKSRSLFDAVTGAVSTPGGTERVVSVEAEYYWQEWLATTGRFEVPGSGASYPVFGLTYYPFKQHLFRVSGELVQQPGNRSAVVFGRVQF